MLPWSHLGKNPSSVDRNSRQPAERRALVLLCGLLCDEEIWGGVASELGPVADIKILSFSNYSSITDMADHVLKSVSGHFAVAGHSMGGRVALEIARHDPRRLSGLALLNTGVHPPGTDEPTNRGRLVGIARELGMSALAEAWLPPLLASNPGPDSALMRCLVAMVNRSTPEGFASQIQALLERPEAREVLADLRVPVQLIAASMDNWSPPKQHEEMRRLCPGSELAIIDNAGHMAPIEQPQAVAAILKSWIRRINEFEETSLTDLERLLIEKACARQIIRYARLNDARAFGPLSELFVEGGALARPADPDATIRGRAEILKAFKSRPATLTRYVISNIEVTVESRERAYATSTILMANGDANGVPPILKAMSIGQFDDVLLKTGDQWLFKERRGRITMKSASL